MANECNGHNVLRGSFSRCYRGAPGLTLLHTKITHCNLLPVIIPSIATEKEITSTFNDLARVSDISHLRLDKVVCSTPLLRVPPIGETKQSIESYTYLSFYLCFQQPSSTSRQRSTPTVQAQRHVNARLPQSNARLPQSNARLPQSKLVATIKLDHVQALRRDQARQRPVQALEPLQATRPPSSSSWTPAAQAQARHCDSALTLALASPPPPLLQATRCPLLIAKKPSATSPPGAARAASLGHPHWKWPESPRD